MVLGDAAFATMGIGTSLAMTGAFLISGELSKIESAKEVPAALRKYEDFFRPYVEKHQKPPPGGMQWANPQTAWGVWVFQAIVGIVAFLRLPQLFMRLFGDDGEEGWKLPDYGW